MIAINSCGVILLHFKAGYSLKCIKSTKAQMTNANFIQLTVPGNGRTPCNTLHSANFKLSIVVLLHGHET